MQASNTSTVNVAAHQVPVATVADVVVTGGGISGLFAALGAARAGAKTVLIDRFGSLGGNLGPGLGQFLEMKGSPRIKHGVGGLPGEFIRRIEILRGVTPGELPSEHPFDPDTTEYVAFKMTREAGVELMLSTYTSNAIVEDNTVKGVFIENKSGRQAVLAKTVIDATGEASVAATTPAPVIPVTLKADAGPDELGAGMGLFFDVFGVDWEKYYAYRRSKRVTTEPVDFRKVADGGKGVYYFRDETSKYHGYKVSDEDQQWIDEVLVPELGYAWGGYPPDMVPLVRKAWENGEFRIVTRIGPSTRVVMRSFSSHGRDTSVVEINGALADPTDGAKISQLEAGARMYIYELVYMFLRKYVPGFENVTLRRIAPFFGSRRGRSIDAEHSVTEQNLLDNSRYDDVIYRYYDLKHAPANCDFPYRALLPKKVDGLLAVGRSAFAPHGPRLRARVMCMYAGQAAGIAAAIAKDAGVKERDLNVKELQHELLKQGYYLGDDQRLQELGLVGD